MAEISFRLPAVWEHLHYPGGSGGTLATGYDFMTRVECEGDNAGVAAGGGGRGGAADAVGAGG